LVMLKALDEFEDNGLNSNKAVVHHTES
jgi:hypothetical protein